MRRSIYVCTSNKLFKKSVTKKCRAQSQILIIMYFVFIPSKNGNKSVALFVVVFEAVLNKKT